MDTFRQHDVDVRVPCVKGERRPRASQLGDAGRQAGGGRGGKQPGPWNVPPRTLSMTNCLVVGTAKKKWMYSFLCLIFADREIKFTKVFYSYFIPRDFFMSLCFFWPPKAAGSSGKTTGTGTDASD